MTTIKDAGKVILPAILNAIIALGRFVYDKAHGVVVAHQQVYPLERRAVARYHAYKTWNQTMWGLFVGAIPVAGILGSVDSEQIDVQAIANSLLSVEWRTYGSLLLSMSVISTLSAWRCWRQWADESGPAIDIPGVPA